MRAVRVDGGLNAERLDQNPKPSFECAPIMSAGQKLGSVWENVQEPDELSAQSGRKPYNLATSERGLGKQVPSDLGVVSPK
jgi:hypothetical protein